MITRPPCWAKMRAVARPMPRGEAPLVADIADALRAIGERCNQAAVRNLPFRQKRRLECHAQPVDRHCDGQEAAVESEPARRRRSKPIACKPVRPANLLVVTLDQGV